MPTLRRCWRFLISSLWSTLYVVPITIMFMFRWLTEHWWKDGVMLRRRCKRLHLTSILFPTSHIDRTSNRRWENAPHSSCLNHPATVILIKQWQLLHEQTSLLAWTQLCNGVHKLAEDQSQMGSIKSRFMEHQGICNNVGKDRTMMRFCCKILQSSANYFLWHTTRKVQCFFL